MQIWHFQILCLRLLERTCFIAALLWQLWQTLSIEGVDLPLNAQQVLGRIGLPSIQGSMKHQLDDLKIRIIEVNDATRFGFGKSDHSSVFAYQ